MNRPHGSQPFHPPRQYQTSPGPPQPQWQASPAPPSGPGGNDPRHRPQEQQQPPLLPAAQHPYNPNIYGPASGPVYSLSSPPPQSQPDPASWGVRYNQNHQFTHYQQPNPPLPPRPPSVGGFIPSSGQQNQTPGPWSQAQGASSYVQAPQWQHDAYKYQETQSVPPPPPPRPPEYLSLPHDTQGWSHPQYSHNPPSHHYEPNSQQSYQTGISSDQHHQGGSVTDTNPVVSPIEPPTTYWHPPLPQTLPSNADKRPENEIRKQTPKPKFGGPSDWEHFEPIADHRTDTTLSGTPTASPQSSRQEVWHSGRSAELPHGPTGVQAAQGLQQPQPNEPPPEQRFSVSSAAAVNSVALPAAPAPLSLSRAHRDPTESRGSSHHDKESPGVSVAVPQRTGTIDSVILAWNKPVEGQTSSTADKPVLSRASSQQNSVSAFSATRPEGELGEIKQQSPKQRYKSNSHMPPSNTNPDPYADLGPEYRASLNRYVIMLRKESEASSEADKFNIFKAFADKELRLRSVLYGLDGREPLNAARENPAEHGSNAEFKDGQNEERLGSTLNPKMPQLMPTTTDAGSRTPTCDSNHEAQSPQLAVSTSPASNEDSFVVVGQPDDEIEYSPGGRPKVPKLQAVAKSPQQSYSKISVATSAPVTSLPKSVASPSENAPIVLDDYSTGGPHSPGRNAPIVLDTQDDPVTRPGNAPLGSEVAHTTPLKFEPPRPVYTPFRYAEASHTDLETLVIQQPAHQAYTAMRQSADSGRILAQASTVIGGASVEGQDTFLGLIRNKSSAHPNSRPATPTNLLVKDPRTEASLALRALVPKALPDESPPPSLAAIGNEMEKLPDEFGFIHETVLRWDRNNRQVRDRQDQERRSRQEESERHIDALYEENEIGYPDIATMEADFKLAEIKKKYEEDQHELESFTTQVFEPVTERLQAEILQLKSQYTLAADLLDMKSDSASHFGNSSEDRVRSSKAIGVIISLFNKIEIRNRKSAEAHFERERRRKKLELTVLHANGDVAAMKTLEQKFLTAEWLQVLHEAQERDGRANELMDTLDRGTARALGENQAYIDDVFTKLRNMDAALAREGTDSSQDILEPEGLRDLLSQARLALNFIAADSDAILRGSNAADTILNDADYAVSVAKAQMAFSPAAAYEKLKEEKQKEDAKIREDLDARLESIAYGPAEALSLLEAIAARLGRDPEHEERLQRALEAAKMRNAVKDPFDEDGMRLRTPFNKRIASFIASLRATGLQGES